MEREVLTWTKSGDKDEETVKDITLTLKRWAELKKIDYETEVIIEGVKGLYKYCLVRKVD